MKPDESISEMYDRLNIIINSFALLVKNYTNAELVKKVLRSLPMNWKAKKIAIEEAKDLTTLRLDQLMGSFFSYEEEKRSYVPQTTKSIAFKAPASTSNKSDDIKAETDEELSMLVKGLNKLLYKKRFKRNVKSKSSNLEDKKGLVCYECKKLGHMRNECPLLTERQKPSRNKRRALLAWSDEKDDEFEFEEEQKANLFYMARSKSESDSDEEDEANLGHRKLGLINFQLLSKIAKKELVRCLPKLSFEENSFCEACSLGKQTKASFKSKCYISTTKSLELLHMDLFGPTRTQSLGHRLYAMVVVDDYSKASSQSCRMGWEPILKA
ncbi:hypothetical protein MLD38_025628 [Melastoma candidum]|uniref:Uncharacterized protein n=1 Tax=Melastoma candidum TaxID=119954 RepID=A0ACB9NW07_9MYRT|nr:hypothetical protein MLD38_025628 [Melastoma candidum]